MQAIRANPGKLKASGTAQGGIWHVALAGLLDEQKIPPTSVVWVPSNGNAAALLDLVAGGIDIVAGSHPEARSLIDSGKVRSLAVLAADAVGPLPPGPETARQAIGPNWTIRVWRGIGAPLNLPPAIEPRLQAAVKKAYDSEEYRGFIANRGFGMRWADPAGFRDMMTAPTGRWRAIMKAVGPVESEPAAPMRLNDTAVRARAGRARRGGNRARWPRRFPPMPGQPVGPALFPIVIGGGLLICAALLSRSRAATAAEAPWVEVDAWVRRPRMVLNFGPGRRLPGLLCVHGRLGWASSSRRPSS